ncbi:MAG TPA: hypothetical protein VJ464_02545 [Blastocatellia bacterium]|nr:hypothetical protein [Blastocatellia bacterium]
MKKLFVAASGIFAAIPGLVIIQTGLGTPPSYSVLFGGCVEAFGALTLVLLWANKSKIVRLTARKATRMSVRLAALCFVSLAIYLLLYNLCIVENPPRGTVYYPLWLSGEAAELVALSGGRSAAIGEYGIMGVREAIAKMPSFALTFTTILLLLIYQAIFNSLAAAFTLIGFREGPPL